MTIQDNEYEIQVDISNEKNIVVYVKYLHKTFKTILPKKLKTHGFGKYNLALKLYNLIIFKTYKMEYYENIGVISLIFSNVMFEPDNKMYNEDINVNLEEYVNYDEYNLGTIVNNLESIDLETSKKLIILNHNHIGILERKIKLLEDKLYEIL